MSLADNGLSEYVKYLANCELGSDRRKLTPDEVEERYFKAVHYVANIGKSQNLSKLLADELEAMAKAINSFAIANWPGYNAKAWSAYRAAYCGIVLSDEKRYANEPLILAKLHILQNQLMDEKVSPPGEVARVIVHGDFTGKHAIIEKLIANNWCSCQLFKPLLSAICEYEGIMANKANLTEIWLKLVATDAEARSEQSANLLIALSGKSLSELIAMYPQVAQLLNWNAKDDAYAKLAKLSDSLANREPIGKS